MKAARRKGEWLEVVTGPVEHNAVDTYMHEQLEFPAKLINKLKSRGEILQQGDRLRIKLFPKESAQFSPQWHDIEVLYEDDFSLAVSKPAGMPVHPAVEGQTATLGNAVSFYYEMTSQQVRVRHIHRLDENTTGPVLYAKNEYAQLKLDEQMREKAIQRTYIAFVRGRLKDDRGRIDAPIGKDRHHKSRRRVSPGGDPAITHYEVIERYEDATWVRLRLETGRTHQIRVHLSHLGHPILGDELYGGPVGLFGRQALHGETLEWIHPWTGESITVDAPWPKDLALLQQKLKE